MKRPTIKLVFIYLLKNRKDWKIELNIDEQKSIHDKSDTTLKK